MDEKNLKSKKVEEETITEVVPTLFIALGGTGAEVLWRIRRRILNTLWGNKNSPVRLNGFSEFPLAEFLHIDLDASTVTESGKSIKSDILYNKIKFSEDEKIVKKLDISKYTRSDDDLSKYPIVEEWFPLSRSKINELNINLEDGAAQIRSFSRLYIFDKYNDIKSSIRNKCDKLAANVSSSHAQDRIGLKIKRNALKVVVVASTAGGTGSGSFIDLGYLIGSIGKEAFTKSNFDCVLNLMLPTGYKIANKERTQANTYAALMELETSMQQGMRYVNGWRDNETLMVMPDYPYTNIYLIDTGNVADAITEKIDDIYEMTADALFEEFSTADFANKKRSVSVNQKPHKAIAYSPKVDEKTYGDMKFSFSRSYSSYGQATIDTHLEHKKNVVIYRQVNGMLKEFFGVSSVDSKVNTPSDSERDDVLSKNAFLGYYNEIINYDFVRASDEFRNGTERTSYPIVNELLLSMGKSIVDEIEENITRAFESIRTGGNYKEWHTKVTEEINKINHDTFKKVESGSGAREKIIESRRKELFIEITKNGGNLLKAFWQRVDNKEMGGLDYTIDLIYRIKDKLDNPTTGVLKNLLENQKWFSKLSEHLSSEEINALKDHLLQAIGQFIGAKSQSEAKLKQIIEAVRLYVRYHLISVASREAHELVKQLSDFLGKKQGTDNDGNPIWSGFIGQLEAGRNTVRSIIAESEEQIALTNEALKQEHAMYFVLPAPKSKLDEIQLLPPSEAKAWAQQAFEDFGGTQQLFEMLSSENGKDELLGKLRNKALSLISEDTTGVEENPLFIALEEKQKRGELNKLFDDLIHRAVPWISTKELSPYLKEASPEDQYKCYIGVKDKDIFEKKFGAILKSHIPSLSKMTAKNIGFVEIDQPGKLVCYIELTGVPLPALKSLNEWFYSYRNETKIPTHTHKDISLFLHPRELTSDELRSLSKDFKLYIEGVALGIIERKAKSNEYTYIDIKRGRKPSIGNEKNIRQVGLPIINYNSRKDIELQIIDDLDNLKSQNQVIVYYYLLLYYKNEVYPILETKDENNHSYYLQSLPNKVCSEILEETGRKLRSSFESDGELDNYIKLNDYSKILKRWTSEIPNSIDDIYKNEVDISRAKSKRVLNRDVFDVAFSISDKSSLSITKLPTEVNSTLVETKSSLADEIKKLAVMKEQGILTDEEFNQLKANLINKMM